LLPTSTKTSLAAWLQENASVKVLLSERVISLKPFTKEALLFGFKYNWFQLNSDSRIQTLVTPSQINKARKYDDEVGSCIGRAQLLGKWFASAGSVETVMALWGIRP
jgi:hypothetical protein